MPTREQDDRATACDGFRSLGLTRRAILKAGALAFPSLTMPSLWQSRALGDSSGKAVSGNGFGRAKSCILIFQWGGPSQLDTWDPKPDAPDSIRGPFKAIPTSVPGTFISEHFPLLAQQAHRLAILRSLTHDDPAHLSSAHRVVTGHLAPRQKSDDAPPSPQDWPNLGSLVAKLLPSRGSLPPAVMMPWTVAHPGAPGGKAPGQHGGWLGKVYDPFRVEGDPNAKRFKVQGLDLPEGVDGPRLDSRRGLLGNLTQGIGLPGPGPTSWSSQQGRALDALSSAEARGAFVLDREDPKIRDRYGRHIHGQCLLLARRLVEAGVPLVTVNWHDDHQNFWDTHSENFRHLKDRLMPPADRAFAALLEDLDSRGLLDETLVVWTGEFGRTPRITNNGTGREHWPRCYSAALAGGGVRGGQTYGASDRWAAYPARDPISPDDIGATILHALGIDPAQQIPDPIGRPLRINDGSPLTSLFS